MQCSSSSLNEEHETEMPKGAKKKKKKRREEEAAAAAAAAGEEEIWYLLTLGNETDITQEVREKNN